MVRANTRNRFIVIGSVFIFLAICNYFMPSVSDDYYNYHTTELGLKAVVDLYNSWAGRLGSLLSVAFVRGLSPLVFDILNTVVGTIFICSLFVLIVGRNSLCDKCDYSILAFICIAILLTTMFGSVFLWQSGATDYLWGYTLIALHWIPYRFFWVRREGVFSIGKVVGLFLLSIFAGWSSEQVGIMSIIVHMALIAYIIYKKSHIPTWYWCGVIAFIVGYCMLYFSPGISARSSSDFVSYISIPDLLSLPLVSLIERGWMTLGLSLPKYAFDLFSLCLMLAIFHKIKQKKLFLCIIAICIVIALGGRFIYSLFFFYVRKVLVIGCFLLSIFCLLQKKHICESLLFIIFFVGLLAPIQVGAIPPRAQFGEAMLLTSISIYLLRETLPTVFKGWMFPILAIICCIGVMSSYIQYYSQQLNMTREITRQKENGVKEIVVSRDFFHSWYPNIGDWENPGPDPENWCNQAYAQHYAVDKFIVR